MASLVGATREAQHHWNVPMHTRGSTLHSAVGTSLRQPAASYIICLPDALSMHGFSDLRKLALGPLSTSLQDVNQKYSCLQVCLPTWGRLEGLGGAITCLTTTTSLSGIAWPLAPTTWTLRRSTPSCASNGSLCTLAPHMWRTTTTWSVTHPTSSPCHFNLPSQTFNMSATDPDTLSAALQVV